jgi:hypothetical protein
LPRPNERVLHRILNKVGRPEDQTGDCVQALAGGGREDLEGLMVSAT